MRNLKILRSIKWMILITLLGDLTIPEMGWCGLRAHGLGLRTSFWNVTNRPTRFVVNDFGEQINLDLGGAGAGLCFTSRLYQNWFFEFNLDVISAVQGSSEKVQKMDFNVSTVVPLLFGLRYHVLSNRFPSAFQPYLTMGAGPYFGTSIELRGSSQQSIGAETIYGAYLGGGMNLMIFDWFALNFDLKYHFPNLDTKHQYSGLQFGFGLNLMWGSKPEVIEVKEVQWVVQDLYPAFYQFYNTYPLALVRIRNTASYPVEVSIRCRISGYSDRPKDSGLVRIEGGKTQDIPVTAYLDPKLIAMSQQKVAILDLEIEAKAGNVYRKAMNNQITIHPRNAWDGDMTKLAFFITPEDETILALSRTVAGKLTDFEPAETRNFRLAQALFAQLQAQGLRYHPDPNIPFYQDDRVQFAGETLKIGLGDCDDLLVLCASLLESAGIHTAFVEVRDPEQSLAHVYLLFDTGLTIDQAALITTNEKRYLLRNESVALNTIWLPLETTLLNEGFEVVWEAGAKNYLEQGIIRAGVANDWVRIIDVR
ncbi:hypothetical protein L0128_15200 [candidate division KSB1 bacterium]|nr:hypothetical protein [candidate division KSB1 bacterium]